jgi:hypothetical protein
MKLLLYAIGIVALMGCGTIDTSTTTTTLPVTIPAVVANKTDTLYLTLTKEGYGFVCIDSLKQWTLENLCKGELIIDTLGLKARFTYSWKKIVSSLSDSLNNQIRMNQILRATVEKQAQEIQQTKIEKTTESTPGQFWIWTNSFLYQFIAFALGITVLLLLQMKGKFIP